MLFPTFRPVLPWTLVVAPASSAVASTVTEVVPVSTLTVEPTSVREPFTVIVPRFALSDRPSARITVISIRRVKFVFSAVTRNCKLYVPGEGRTVAVKVTKVAAELVV